MDTSPYTSPDFKGQKFGMNLWESKVGLVLPATCTSILSTFNIVDVCPIILNVMNFVHLFSIYIYGESKTEEQKVPTQEVRIITPGGMPLCPMLVIIMILSKFL